MKNLIFLHLLILFLKIDYEGPIDTPIAKILGIIGFYFL